MKISLRKKDGGTWYDITRYVNMPIPILDTHDDNFDNIVIEALLDSTFTFSDYTKAITPKNLLKITYAQTTSQENEQNTYIFWTSNNNTARLRKETNGKTALYNHIIKGEELKKMLGWFNQPSYAVTQQKRSILQYDYRDVIVTYTNLGGKFEASGTIPYQIPIGTKRTDFNYNNGGNEVEVDYVGNKHKVIINDIANTPYSVNYTYSLARTAQTRFRWGIFNIPTQIYPSKEFLPQFLDTNRNLKYTITKRYYDNNNALINTEEEVLLKQYITNSFVTESGGEITSFPELSQQQINIVVGANLLADYVVIEVDVVHEVPQYNVYRDLFTSSIIPMTTNISGFNNNSFVKTAIEELEIEVLSSNTVTPSVFQDITYKQFLDKVIFDYNANNMIVLDYAEDYSVLLGEFMNDGEYDEMSTLEIFERVADLLNVEFYLNNDFKIMFLQKTVSSITLDLNAGLDVQEQIDDIDYVDTAVLSGKNVLSTNDFVREKILIGSTAEEYTYLLEDTIKEYGFKLSKGILELREALLYMPITITLQNENDTPIDIKGNTDLGDGWWNITTRVFDEDTYNSLPNTRADMYNTVLVNNYKHSMDTRLYRSTALSFKVGGKEINNVLYRAETLPELLPSWLEFNAGSGISEYAIINILIVLAIEKAVEDYSYVTSNITFNKPDIQWTNSIFKEAVLDISYIPIFDKITAKFVNDEKNSLKVEKRLTAEGKNISFENAEELYIKDIKSKAVDEKTYDLNHNTFEDTFEVGSIINDGYYIYSKKMMIETNNKMSVTYGLSKNIESSVKARDIGFSSQYDNKYMIPIEYVAREIMIENHLIIGGVNAGSVVGCSADFVYDLFNKSFDGRRMWGLLNLTYESDSDKILVMRMGAIKAKRTLVIQGQFLDNYNAGNQNYTTASRFRQSSPYRYTDVNGRVKSVNRLKIGYNQSYDVTPTLVRDTDLAYNYGNSLDDPYTWTEPYQLNLFPQGEHYNSSSVVDKVAYIDTNYLPYSDEWLLWKDSREALRVNFLTTIENRDKDKLAFYQISKVTKVALRSGDKIWGQETTNFTIDVIESFGTYVVTINILSGLGTDPALHSLGLSLIGNELGADILVAEIKEPTVVDGNTVEFQIASIRSGTKNDYEFNNYFSINEESEYLIGIDENIYINKVLEFEKGESHLHEYTVNILLETIEESEYLIGIDEDIILNKLLEVNYETGVVSYKWTKVGSLASPYDYDLDINQSLPLPNDVGIKVRKKLTNATTGWVVIPNPGGVVFGCNECPPTTPAPLNTTCTCGGVYYKYSNIPATYEYYISEIDI